MQLQTEKDRFIKVVQELEGLKYENTDVAEKLNTDISRLRCVIWYSVSTKYFKVPSMFWIYQKTL